MITELLLVAMVYYHVYVWHCDKKSHWNETYELDFSIEDLMERIVSPFLEGSAFMCGGQPVDTALVKTIKISSTDEPSSKLSPRLAEEAKSQGLFISEEFCLMEYGKNVTRELIKHPPKKQAEKEETCSAPRSNKVFIVHGWDDEMKIDVARTVEKLGLQAIILHEQPNGGSRTIIEKFSDYADVSFAIVLLSPDDMAYTTKEKPENAKARARQNVVLELGYFMGKLGREKVFPLLKKTYDIEIPSDYSGVVYTEYDTHGVWRYRLAKELRAGGFDVDANKL
jgi:predicted nucleotide-binding protein